MITLKPTVQFEPTSDPTSGYYLLETKFVSFLVAFSHAKFYGHSLEDPDYVGQAKRLAEKIREKFGPVEARSSMPLSMLEQLDGLLALEMKAMAKKAKPKAKG